MLPLATAMLILFFTGQSGDIGTIGDVKISPDPPQKGQNITIDADITLSKYNYSSPAQSIFFFLHMIFDSKAES